MSPNLICPFSSFQGFFYKNSLTKTYPQSRPEWITSRQTHTKTKKHKKNPLTSSTKMGKKKGGKKKKKKGGGFALRGDPPEAEIKTHDLIRAEGLKLYDDMSQQIFTIEAPSYVNFLYQKEQAAVAAANADKPKKAGKKGSKGKKKGKKGKKKGKKKK